MAHEIYNNRKEDKEDIIKRSLYIINPEIRLIPVNNDNQEIYNYIIKMHKHHNTIDDMYPISDINKFDKLDNSVFWLIKYKENTIGIFNIIYRKQAIEKALEIHRLYIDDEYREYKIGTKILQRFKEIAKKTGYSTITAKVYCDNPAISFYERNNFKTYYRYMTLDL